MNYSNQIWNFLASVRLAIFTLFAIALTSIIGTIIPQGRELDFYINTYGLTIGRFFHVLDIPNMYGSWWYLSLLGLLSANLIVCSLDRFPFAWKQIVADQSEVSIAKLEKMAFTHRVFQRVKESADDLASQLKKRGWQIREKTTSDSHIIAAQRGSWSRLGVYLVHTSILVIFVGAIVGHFLGFKGSVLIPETKQTDKIYAAGGLNPINLGFSVRCDKFEIEFYDNTMPKEYRSRLTVLDGGKQVLVKDIEVNHPLKYKGITFYQSSYEAYRDFLITLTDPADGSQKSFVAPFQQQVSWPEKNILLGVVNAKAIREQVVQMKIWVKSGNEQAISFWLDPQKPTPLTDLPYIMTVKQMYATGLQVAKDPGVWLVYLGCLMMLVGLFVAFFTSHRRIWIVTTRKDGEESLLIAGATNKNKLSFEKTFSQLVSSLHGNPH